MTWWVFGIWLHAALLLVSNHPWTTAWWRFHAGISTSSPRWSGLWALRWSQWVKLCPLPDLSLKRYRRWAPGMVLTYWYLLLMEEEMKGTSPFFGGQWFWLIKPEVFVVLARYGSFNNKIIVESWNESGCDWLKWLVAYISNKQFSIFPSPQSLSKIVGWELKKHGELSLPINKQTNIPSFGIVRPCAWSTKAPWALMNPGHLVSSLPNFHRNQTADSAPGIVGGFLRYLRARTSAGTSKENNVEEEIRNAGPFGSP